MKTPVDEFRFALQANATRHSVEIAADVVERLCDYFELVCEWNPRLHLVAPCSAKEFATRHVLESLLLLPHLPADARVGDIGSGAGLPIIPVLIVRHDLRASLIEASQKKSVFLREALRVVAVANRATVLADRFENLTIPDVEFITCRALDRFSELFPRLVAWTPQAATLLLFGGDNLGKQIETAGLKCKSIHIPESERRWLFVVGRGSRIEEQEQSVNAG